MSETSGIFGDGFPDEDEGQALDGQPAASSSDGQPGAGPEGQPTEGSEPAAPSGQPQQTPEGGPAQTGQPEADAEVDWTFGGQFKDPAALAKSYKEARAKLSQRDEEREALRQYALQAQMQLQQMAQYIQMLQMQPQQQPQSLQPDQQQAGIELDSNRWLEDFYSRGPEAVLELVRGELDRQAQQLGMGLQQVLAPIQQFVQSEQQLRQEAMNIAQTAKKYPDFYEYEEELAQIFRDQPMLKLMPDGPETAYQMAKAQRSQKQAAQMQQQQTITQKQAARMPASTGSRPGVAKSIEDQIKESLFGADPKGGLFG